MRCNALGLLRGATGWRVRNLFIYRNPYDMAATEHLALLRRAGGNGRSAALRRDIDGLTLHPPPPPPPPRMSLSEFTPKPGEEPPLTAQSVAHVLAWSDHLVDVLPLFAEGETLAVRHEDFVAAPKERLRHILAFWKSAAPRTIWTHAPRRCSRVRIERATKCVGSHPMLRRSTMRSANTRGSRGTASAASRRACQCVSPSCNVRAHSGTLAGSMSNTTSPSV